MGYLHEGHASLVERAAADSDTVVTSVFVNPLQFAPPRRPARPYPRDLERDTALAEAALEHRSCSRPTVEEMYPVPILTTVSVERDHRNHGRGEPAHALRRGGHGRGEAPFNIVGPCRAYFGEKDYCGSSSP